MDQLHFTYHENLDSTVLQQGDVLEKTNELCEALKEIHPHYLKADYTHFMVLTQSCDLVVRSGELPSSRYITIAAIRPLSLALERELDKKGQPIQIAGEPYRNESVLGPATQFLERLLNNNNTDYFYLREAPGHGLNEDSCCFLHLSIALRAEDHYEKCLKAKRLELAPVFQSKLGWLVGNLYSRVGTPDWVPEAKSKKEFKAFIKDTLEGNVLTVPQDAFQIFGKLSAEEPSASFDDIYPAAREELEQRELSKITNLVELIGQQAALTPEQKDTLLKAIKTHKPLRKALNLPH